MEKRIYETSWTEERRINREAGDTLIDISKWAKFLSIIGFVFLGLSLLALIGVVLTVLGANGYIESYNDYRYTPGVIYWGFVVAYCILILIYFFPIFFLYKFSVKIKKSVIDNSSLEIAEAFGFLKKHYVYIGILTIIMIAFLIMSFVMVLIRNVAAM